MRCALLRPARRFVPRGDKACEMPRPRRGSNPARTSVIQVVHPTRAEIFALPSPGAIDAYSHLLSAIRHARASGEGGPRRSSWLVLSSSSQSRSDASHQRPSLWHPEGEGGAKIKGSVPREQDESANERMSVEKMFHRKNDSNS